MNIERVSLQDTRIIKVEKKLKITRKLVVITTIDWEEPSKYIKNNPSQPPKLLIIM